MRNRYDYMENDMDIPVERSPKSRGVVAEIKQTCAKAIRILLALGGLYLGITYRDNIKKAYAYTTTTLKEWQQPLPIKPEKEFVPVEKIVYKFPKQLPTKEVVGLIFKWAKHYDVNPYLALAVAYQESKIDQNAINTRSNSNNLLAQIKDADLGVMQVKYETALGHLAAENLAIDSPMELLEPDLNTRLGVRHLAITCKPKYLKVLYPKGKIDPDSDYWDALARCYNGNKTDGRWAKGVSNALKLVTLIY